MALFVHQLAERWGGGADHREMIRAASIVISSLDEKKSNIRCFCVPKKRKGKKKYLIKVSNDLVEQPQTLDTHVVSVQLDVKVIEVCDGRKKHADLRVGLVVEILQGATNPRELSPFKAHFTNVLLSS